MQRIALSVIAFICFFCSCTNRDNPAVLVPTPSFDSVLSNAERLHDAGNNKAALKLVLTAYKTYAHLTVADKMNYFTYVGEAYRRDENNYDEYIASADSIIRILEESGQTKNLAFRYVQAYNMKADALFAKGLYNESYDYYYKAKTLARETSDSCSLSKFSYSLGMVLYKQQRFPEAAYHFIESYNESNACKDIFLYFYHRQELLDNIGLSFKGAQKYDSALLYYQKALNYIDANSTRFDKKENLYITARAVVYGNMGDVYIALNNYDTATALLKKSIAINLQKGYTNNDALVDQVKLANLYLITKKMTEVKTVLDDVKAELDTIPDKNVELSLNKLMWQYYDQVKDSATANRYLRAYAAMNDSFMASNKLLLASDVDGRIKNLERQNNINLLNKNNELEKTYLVIAAIVVLMALIIIAFILRNAYKSKKNVAILTDLNNKVNEQKTKVERTLDELKLKERDNSRILRSVAHDVMNPIAAIISLTDILISESESYSQEQLELFDLIKEACNNSLSLSKDILDAAVTVDPAHVSKEWVNVNKLVANSVKLQNVHAANKNQRIIVTAEKEEIKAYINRKKIWRLINNLIGNAIKFSYPDTDIEIHVGTISDKLHISVKDHGVGIPDSNKPYIFDIFTDAKKPGTSGETPHGLGLSISMQIAKSHNGNIWFESEEGKGTTFHVQIPLNADK